MSIFLERFCSIFVFNVNFFFSKQSPPAPPPSTLKTVVKLNPSKRRRYDSFTVPNHFDPQCVLKRDNKEKLWHQLMESICLDHSYASYFEVKEEPLDDSSKNVVNTDTGVRNPAISLLTKQDRLLSVEDRGKDDHTDELKYKNFNLLLKCLTNVEEGDVEMPSNDKDELDPHKQDSNGNMLGDDSGRKPGTLFTCSKCSRRFSKKRYLVKHFHRMHPNQATTDFEGFVACAKCGVCMLQSSLKKHTAVCQHSESDLANCQFCGLRMRRHILVKHLAQEHCVERDVMSDGDSSTLSGSEHEPTVSPTKAICGVCRADVRLAVLEQHILDTHLVTTSACPVCTVQMPKLDLAQHIISCHCRGYHSAMMAAGSRCRHSMLQRFLNDSNGGSTETVDSCEQCAVCVSSLVTDLVPPPSVSTAASHDTQCSFQKDTKLLERTTVELIEAACQM